MLTGSEELGAVHTIGEVADCNLPWIVCEVSQGHIGFALSNHEMDDDQALEDNGPGRVSKSILKSSKDLGDSGLASMSRNENVLDIFGLWCCELTTISW
jgi:hypothetical protein